MIDSSRRSDWSRDEPEAGWSFPSSFPGHGVPSGPGDTVHVLPDRAAHLSRFFLLSTANKNDFPFADPLLGLGRLLLALPIYVVRTDGARPRGNPGQELVRFIITEAPSGPGAHSIVPFNRTKQPLGHVRDLVDWPPSDRARAGAPFRPERFFAGATRSNGVDTRDPVG